MLVSLLPARDTTVPAFMKRLRRDDDVVGGHWRSRTVGVARIE